MGKHYRESRSIYEWVGRIVLLPFMMVLGAIAVPVLIVMYPVIGMVIMVKSEGSITERMKNAVLWPFTLLAFNEFLSLGGLNNPLLSKVTRLLERIYSRKG